MLKGGVTGAADGSHGQRAIVSPASTAANAQTRAEPDVAAVSRATTFANRAFAGNRA
jgi:hypothetical protein